MTAPQVGCIDHDQSRGTRRYVQHVAVDRESARYAGDGNGAEQHWLLRIRDIDGDQIAQYVSEVDRIVLSTKAPRAADVPKLPESIGGTDQSQRSNPSRLGREAAKKSGGKPTSRSVDKTIDWGMDARV